MGIPVYRTASTVPQYTDISVYRYTPTVQDDEVREKVDICVTVTLIKQESIASLLLEMSVSC